MSELDNRVNIAVTIADTTATRAGFGILAIVHEHGKGTDRVLTYNGFEGLKADFPVYTPVGRFAEIFFSQTLQVKTVKVIEIKTAESHTAALGAAAAIDNDWYMIGCPSANQGDQENCAEYALTSNKIAVNCIDDADAITSADTDLGSVLQGLGNNRAATWYSRNRGQELAISDITVASTIATVTHTAASADLAVGDKIGIWDSVIPALNARWKIGVVNSSTEFEITVPAGTSSDATSTQGWAKFNLIDAGISGKMLPYNAGSRTWDLQLLAGVTTDNLSPTEQGYLGGKNINWFSSIAGLNVTGGLESNGGGGKLASGRYLDIQRGADWLESNLQIDLFELMVRSGGNLGYDALGFQSVESVIGMRLHDGLDKGFLTPFVSGPYAGQDWIIQMPNLADIPSADKINRLLQGTRVYANIRGKIHNLAAAITLSI